MTTTATLRGAPVATLDRTRPECAVLDLLHPDGAARRVGWIGAPSDPDDRPTGSLSPEQEGGYDALLIESKPDGPNTADWFESVIARVDRLLTPDGVAYFVLPRRDRWRLLRDLPGRAFRISATYMHVPYGSSAQYLVECETTAIRLLSGALPIRAARKRIIQTGIQTFPAMSTWLPFTVKHLGVAVQRADARRLFDWATSWSAGAPLRARLARVKARSDSRNGVVWLFGDGAAVPCAIVKRALNDSAAARIAAELEALEELAPGATAAGASVPAATPLPSPLIAARYDYIDAIPADALLAAQPDRLRNLVRQIARWVERWNGETRIDQQIDTAWLKREVLAPGHAVQSVLENPDAYFRWLSDACARLAGRTLAVVAVHSDLTMSNVLVPGSGSLAIVDWESARRTGLPLSDLYYAAADGLAATDRYRDRAGALALTFAPQSDYGRFTADLASSVDRAIAADRELMEVLIHATAFHHAVNERQKGNLDSGPFAQLVRTLEARVTRTV